MDFVVAVTVTYNSAEILRKTINALLNQTRDVSKIIIVDNDSDETNKKVIKELSLLSKKIILVNLASNLGGAGGFEAGVKYAINNFDFDWIWLMDDDAYPDNYCLEKLLLYKNASNVGCLAPLIYGIDNKQFQLYHHKFVKRFGSKDIIAYDSYDKIPEISKIDANAFVGPLISRKAVDELGSPDGSLFIYGDDQEYTYRISRHFNLYLIKDALIFHRDVSSSASGSPKAWWKDYYMHRNRLLFVKKFNKQKIKAFLGIEFVRLGILKRIISTRLSRSYSRTLKNKRVYLLKKAMFDGSKGISGKTIDPSEYIAWYKGNFER